VALQLPQFAWLENKILGTSYQGRGIIQIEQADTELVYMSVIVSMIQDQPTMLSFDRNTVAANPFLIPTIFRPRPKNRTHPFFRPVRQIIGFRQPDLRRTAVQRDISFIDTTWEEHMILIVLTSHDCTDRFPRHEVVTYRDHRCDPAAQVGCFD